MKKIISFLLSTSVGKSILELTLLQFKEFLIKEIEHSNSTFMKAHKISVIMFINGINIEDFIKNK